MKYTAKTVAEYLAQVPEERQPALDRLRDTIRKNLPVGFEERIQYNMPGYVVPHALYPSGYHCRPEDPLPFVNFASQKNFIALYHMGIYVDKELYDWFVNEYPKHCSTKLDMGKSCIRFKKIDDIPYDLIADLMRRMTPQAWIALYEKHYRSNSPRKRK